MPSRGAAGNKPLPRVITEGLACRGARQSLLHCSCCSGNCACMLLPASAAAAGAAVSQPQCRVDPPPLLPTLPTYRRSRTDRALHVRCAERTHGSPPRCCTHAARALYSVSSRIDLGDHAVLSPSSGASID